MVQYLDLNNLVREQQMGSTLQLQVLFVLNPAAQKLRFPFSKGDSFVMPKTLLGTVPKGVKTTRIVVSDFIKEISYGSTSLFNEEWPREVIGADPIELTLTLDNRFGRFNYIPPGTMVQLRKMVKGRFQTFLTCYIWNIERVSSGPSEEAVLTCVDRLYWMKMTDVDVTLNADKTVAFNLSREEVVTDTTVEAAPVEEAEPLPEGESTTTTTGDIRLTLGSSIVLSETASADKLIIAVAKAHKIPLGKIVKTNTRITRNVDFPTETTVLEYILTVLRMTKTAMGELREVPSEDPEAEEGEMMFVQDERAKSVQFDVHARDGRLNVIPIKTPLPTAKLIRFTDDVMIRSGIKLSETYSIDESKFATQFLVMSTIQTTTVTGAAPEAGAELDTELGANGEVIDGEQPLGSQLEAEVQKTSQKEVKYWSSSVSNKPNITWAPFGGSSKSNVNLLTDNNSLSYIFLGATTDPYHLQGNFTFPAHPTLIFKGKRDVNPLAGTPSLKTIWTGNFTTVGAKSGVSKAKSTSNSRPGSTEVEASSIKQNKAKLAATKESTASVTGSEQPAGSTLVGKNAWIPENRKYPSPPMPSISWVPNKPADGTSEIDAGRGNLGLFVDINSVATSILYTITSANHYSFPNYKGLTFVGTRDAPQGQQTEAIWRGTFFTKGFKVGTSSPGGGGSTPGDTGSGLDPTTGEALEPVATEDQLVVDITTYVKVDPKNLNIQKAFGLVTRRFQLSKYTGSTTDDSLTLEKQVAEARKRIEDAWRPEYTLSFTSSGIMGLWANSYIYVSSNTATVEGVFLIKSIKYTISKRQIIMAIDVNVTKESVISPAKFEGSFRKYLRY